MAVSPDDLVEAGIRAGMLERKDLATLRVEARRRRESLLVAVTRHGRFPISALHHALAELR